MLSLKTSQIDLTKLNWKQLLETQQTLSTQLTTYSRELEWLKQNERLQFFEPNGPQERFIEIVGDGQDIVYVFSAANGVGKTTLVVNILGNIIFGPQNRFFHHPIFKDWPFPKRARYITDPKLVEDIGPFHSEIEKWWPKGKYEALKAGHNYFSQYKANGWVIDVMTYEQSVKDFEGVTLGLGIFDEPPPEEIYHATMSRFRSGGFAMVPMTPLTQAAWFFDRVVPAHPHSIVYAAIEENCKQHGKRGTLEHDQIEKIIGEMPPDEVEARAFGKALYLSGVIYRQFDQRVHVLKEMRQAPAGATLYHSVDPHSDKPFACVWGYPEPNGDFIIVDEWPNYDFYSARNCQLTIHDYARIFREKEQGMRVHKRIIDRHFADVASAVNKRTLREELRDEVNLDFYPSYKAEQEVETGIMRVRSYLAFNEDRPISALNKPKLYINPHCINTIKSFQRWAFDPENGKVKDEYKDFMDAVRYLLMDDPKIDVPVPYFEPVKMW